MKTPSTRLFELIKALSKTEKSYFKKFSVPNSSSNSASYIAIFDAIAKMDHYDEAILKKRFGARHFSEMKQYLYKQIRKALRNYHAEKNVEIKLYNYLTDLHILYKKGLYQHCRDLIKKAEKLARELEYYEILLQLNAYKVKVRNSLEEYAQVQELAIIEMEDFKVMVAHLENTLQYRIYKDLLFVERSHRVGTIGIKEISSTYSPPPNPPSTIFGMLYQEDAKCNLSGMTNDMAAYVQTRKNLVQLHEDHPAFRKENPELYIIALFDWINTCAVAHQPEIGLANMPKARKAINELKLEPHFKLIRKAVLGSFELQLNFELHNYDRAEALFPQYLIWLKHNAAQINARHVLIFYYRLLTGAIYFEKYDAALNIGALILDNSRFHIRLDIQVFTRFMLILVHFELGNLLFLESFLHSTYQFIRNHDYQSKFSTLFLQFFKNQVIAQDILNPKIKQQLLQAFKQKIQTLFEEVPSAALVNNYFQFIRWIDSRLKGISMSHLNSSMDQRAL